MSVLGNISPEFLALAVDGNVSTLARTFLTFRKDGKQKKETVYPSRLNIKITASKNPVIPVLVYGLGKTP